MGGEVSKLVDIEKTSWVREHKLGCNEALRKEQVRLLTNFGPNLQICYNTKKLYGIQYQHWFVMDRDSKWIIEFGGGVGDSEDHQMGGGGSVAVHCSLKSDYLVSADFKKTDSVAERMEKVCGATNYSLALRNCEHLARYSTLIQTKFSKMV